MTQQAHAPLIAGQVLVPSGTLQVISCANWRTDGTVQSCAIGLVAGLEQCAQCKSRVPLVAIPMDSSARMPPPVPAHSARRRWRGMGDAVAALIRVLFLGRVDIAQRIAAKVERQVTPEKPGASGGCGCKQRQAALNRAIPFDRNANRLHRN